MSERNKGIFHALLAVVGIAEIFTSKSKARTALVGACVGWHVYAVYEHFRDAEKGNQ